MPKLSFCFICPRTNLYDIVCYLGFISIDNDGGDNNNRSQTPRYRFSIPMVFLWLQNVNWMASSSHLYSLFLWNFILILVSFWLPRAISFTLISFHFFSFCLFWELNYVTSAWYIKDTRLSIWFSVALTRTVIA